jgi:hypothetical protein
MAAGHSRVLSGAAKEGWLPVDVQPNTKANMSAVVKTLIDNSYRVSSMATLQVVKGSVRFVAMRGQFDGYA